MHENRETSGVPRSSGDRGRSEKVQSRTSDMHALEGSDRAVVPMNQPSKGGQPSTEVGEERVRTKENIAQCKHEPDTERGTSVPGIARCARSSQGKEARTVHRSSPPSDVTVHDFLEAIAAPRRSPGT